jgi:hypothetical protein
MRTTTLVLGVWLLLTTVLAPILHATELRYLSPKQMGEM